MLQIGSWRLESPWILAPMAGVSEWPYRVIALRLGAAAAPTELMSSKALIERTQRSLRYMDHVVDAERPFWVQLFGGEPATLEQASAVAAELGAHILDLNLGCPVKKVTKSGAGSALLTSPERVGPLLEAMRRGSGLPVTLKIRAGWDESTLTYRELAQVASEAGASAIAMHARTRQQGYTGTAHWDWIEDLAAHSPLPVIGNGDVFSAEGGRRMIDETKCAAVMVGRAALGNPWIFRQLRGDAREVTPDERARVILEHFDSNLSHNREPLRAVRRFRKHLRWYARGLEGSSEFLASVFAEDDIARARRAIEGYFYRATRVSEGRIEFDEKTALG